MKVEKFRLRSILYYHGISSYAIHLLQIAEQYCVPEAFNVTKLLFTLSHQPPITRKFINPWQYDKVAMHPTVVQIFIFHIMTVC